MEEDSLRSFIDQILQAKNLSGVDAEVKKQLHDDLRAQLLEQINAALVRELDETKLDEFNDLLDNPEVTDDQVQRFISSSGVDTQRVAAATMLRFRDLYLGKPESKEV